EHFTEQNFELLEFVWILFFVDLILIAVRLDLILRDLLDFVFKYLIRSYLFYFEFDLIFGLFIEIMFQLSFN
ncbi:MAG: hypothetical protein Q8835_03555, partial [Sweet potato little leaf phytoplasma]|nr:hypothetical protein [Sweet potato little leaf phytoplasma]